VPGRQPSRRDKRYGVLERRDVREAVVSELWLIAAFLLVELLLLGAQSIVFAAAICAALVALLILAVQWRLGGSRHPHPTAFAIGVVLAVMGIVAATTIEVAVMAMVGLAAVVIVGCAVIMPWNERWHVAFLVMYGIIYLGGVLVVVPLPAAQRESDLLVGVAAIATSAGGSLLQLRRRRRRWQAELDLRQQRMDLRAAVARLEDANAQIRRLEGILPICANCKRIHDGDEWTAVERYVQRHSDARFSHGICPECLRKLYPEYAGDAVPAADHGS